MEDNEELARQAMESVKAVQTLSSQPSGVVTTGGPISSQEDEEQVYDSQASRAAAKMLRQYPGQEYSGAPSLDASVGPAEKSAAMHAKLFTGSKTAAGAEKRKLAAEGETQADSPQKKLKAGGAASDGRRVGLGIQY